MPKIIKFLAIAFISFSCRSTNQNTLSGYENAPFQLSLGDSIAFGYNPLIEMKGETVKAGLFVGYPEVVGQKMGYRVVNSACTGETSFSFLDDKGLDNGCHTGEKPFRSHLKVSYTDSQMAFALEFLRKNPDTKLVTLTVGGNDVLVAENDCNKTKLPVPCKASKVPWLLFNLAKNVGKIVDEIKKTGYTGPIVFLTQYARNYRDPVQTAALSAIQLEIKGLAKLKKFTVVSGFDTFRVASEAFEGDACKAGLMIPLPEGGCNQHPSAKGRELLGQAVVDVLKGRALE